MTLTPLQTLTKTVRDDDGQIIRYERIDPTYYRTVQDSARRREQLEAAAPQTDDLTFPYRYGDERLLYPDPMVPVDLVHLETGDLVREWATVDTGSSLTNFPRSMMERLGVPAELCQATGLITAEGEVEGPYFPWGIEARVGGYRVQLAGQFTPNFPVIVLGREDFLNAFTVHFDQRNYLLHLEPHEDTEYVGNE